MFDFLTWPASLITKAALGLLAVLYYSGADFCARGGRGKIRRWAAAEACKLRLLICHLNRLTGRTGAARHPKIMVLKKIITMKKELLQRGETWLDRAMQHHGVFLMPPVTLRTSKASNDSMASEEGAPRPLGMEDGPAEGDAAGEFQNPPEWEWPEDLCSDVEMEEGQDIFGSFNRVP